MTAGARPAGARPAPGDLVPPEHLRPLYARRGSFLKEGARFLDAAVHLAGLKPHHRVLDLGCGVGRFAVALSVFLDSTGRYEGLDASEEAVAVCREFVGARLPRFRFTATGTANGMYNPGGAVPAAEYRFPFDDGTFDVVFSNSLFTHLLPDETRTYLAEIGRVLVPGGRTLNTFFLLDAEAERLVDAGRAVLALPVDLGPCRALHPDVPERAVAYREEFVLGALAAAGLALDAPIRRGSWCGRATDPGPGFGNKDIVVASRLALEVRPYAVT